MKVVNDFKDYEIIDASLGMKYERWGNVYLLRPDPLAMWNTNLKTTKLDATYIRSNKGGGYWENNHEIKPFTINYKNLKFNIKQMGFKHTGLFPEQAINWDYMMNKIEGKKDVKILNLFAYTGGASIACLSKGASVCHVDSSKGMVEWAKENVKLNNLEDRPIRFIIDDVRKFVKREIRRGNKYDGIIMDPPSYGKGANREIWNIEDDLFELVSDAFNLLSDKPLFFIINSYSGLSPVVLENIMKLTDTKNGKINVFEIGLPITNNNLTLPCGITGICEYE